MTSSAIRLQKELKAFQQRPAPYTAFHELHHDSLSQWVVFIFGPEGTAYEGGMFRVLVRFPDSYPMDPPSLQFLSDFFHPNVYRDGKVCISTLQQPIPEELRDEGYSASDSGANWSPALGIDAVFMSVISMLSDPNPDDPANSDAAAMYRTKPSSFHRRVRELSEISQALAPPGLLEARAAQASTGCAGCTCPGCGMVCDQRKPCMFTCMCDDDCSEDFDFDDEFAQEDSSDECDESEG